MKYIRTKDGRIISEDDIPNYYGGLVSVVGLDLDYREADNIEELLDELVYVQPNHTPNVMYEDLSKLLKDDSWGKKIRNDIKNDYQYFGAIWTAKGLIYVAKLNEKGEWELI